MEDIKRGYIPIGHAVKLNCNSNKIKVFLKRNRIILLIIASSCILLILYMILIINFINLIKLI